MLLAKLTCTRPKGDTDYCNNNGRYITCGGELREWFPGIPQTKRKIDLCLHSDPSPDRIHLTWQGSPYRGVRADGLYQPVFCAFRDWLRRVIPPPGNEVYLEIRY